MPLRRRADPAMALRRRGGRRRTIAVATLLVLLLVVGGGLFVYRALLPEALAPRLVEVLESKLGPGTEVTVGATRLVTSSGMLELEVENLAITDAQGREVALAPEARLEIDRNEIMGGTVALKGLHLERPRLTLRGSPERALPPEDPSTPVSAADRDIVAHLVDTLDRLTGPGGAAAALDYVRVRDATVAVDRGEGASVNRLEHLMVRVSRNPETNGFAATIGSEGSIDRWSATLTSTPPSATGRVFDLGLDNVRLSSLAQVSGIGSEGAEAYVSGHLSLRLDGQAVIAGGEARLDVSRIGLRLPGPKKEMVSFDELRLRMRWDAESRTLRLEPSVLAAGAAGVTFVGEARAPAPGTAGPWSIILQAGNAKLPGGPKEPPLRLDRILVRGGFNPSTAVLDIAEAQVLGPTVSIAASGAVTFGDSSPGIALGLAAAPTTVSALKRLWPFFVAAPVREWFVDNVQAASLSGFLLRLDIKPGVLANLGPWEPLPDEQLQIEANFADGALTADPSLPLIVGASGRFRATGRHVQLHVDSGRIEPMPGTSIALKGLFEVPDTEPRYPGARVKLDLEGPLNGVTTLFAQGALGPNPLPPAIDPAAVRGTVAATATVNFTLGPKEAVPPMEVKVDGGLKDVFIDKIVAGKPLEAGNFRVQRAAGVASLTGEAKVGGATATIDLRDEGASGRRELVAVANLDAAARAKLGLPAANTLKGPMPVKVRAPLEDGPIAIEADLAAAAVDGLVPGFTKRAGTPGKLALTVVKEGDRTILRDVVLESGPASVKGTAELDAAGNLISARLASYKLSANDDIRVAVDRGKGLTKVSVAGGSMDLRPLMADLLSASGEDTSNDIELDVALDSALGNNGEIINGLKLNFARRGGKVRVFDLKSERLGGGRFSIQPSGDGNSFLIAGDDGGAFFRFLDLYAKAYGGKFTLRIVPAAKTNGVLEVENFQIRGERALAAVAATEAVAREDSRSAQRRNPEHTVQFTSLKMAFARSGGRMALSDVVIWGPQLGVTLEGVLDFTADKVNVTGTYVPAYALNNLFSKLPVIGFFLGGGSNEGLVGVTFRVTGSVSNPTLTINPMSAVAPGFLRKLFEFRSATEGTASVTPPAPRTVPQAFTPPDR